MKRTDAAGATIDNKFTNGNPPSIPATVVDDSWLNNVQEEIAGVIEAAGLTLDGGDFTQLLQAIRVVGGGGGGSAIWNADNADAPVQQFENNVPVFLFEDGFSQALYLMLKLGENFSVGPQIQLALGHYSPSTGNGYVMKTTTSLIRAGQDALSSTTNQHVSSQAIANAAPTNHLNTTQHNLTDASGQINSVDPSGGDILIIKLERDIANGSDTDTESVRFLPQATEVKLG